MDLLSQEVVLMSVMMEMLRINTHEAYMCEVDTGMLEMRQYSRAKDVRA